MSRRIRCLAATCLVIAVTASSLGCLTVGRSFPTAPVTEITVGETAKVDVRARFGEPWRTGVEDGQETWTYGHYRYRALGATETTDLVLRFDRTGTVASYSFNTTQP